MAVYRVRKTRDFTTMSNHHLKNRKLSLKAKGMLSQILSFPDNWEFSLKGLAALSLDSIDSTRAAILELEKAGYVTRQRIRNSNGQLGGSEYTIYELPCLPDVNDPTLDEPILENPIQAKPTVGLPAQENPTQLNTNQKSRTQESKTLMINNLSINHSEAYASFSDGMDAMETRNTYRELICENLEYDIIRIRDNGERLDEIVEIMLDAVCSTQPAIRINGEDMPLQVVKSRLLKLRSSHIEYVFDAMRECPSDIRNIRAYMLTTLYNATLTMDNYYTAKVNHDFYG